MSTLTISEPVALACGECASGYYVGTAGTDAATCALCGNTVCPSFDIERFLEPGERMVWLTDGAETVLAYFTEETTDDDDQEA